MSVPHEVSAELFRAIAEYTYDWESWVDAEGVPRWTNAAVVRITGYTVEECLSRADYPLFLASAADKPVLERVLREAARGGSGNDVEFRIAHKDGTQRWVAISWQSVRSPGARALGYRTSVRDIDQRKRTEDELHAIRRRAEALAQARSELLANVSHELRSPAHHIAGFAELLLESRLTTKQRRYVEVIADQSRSMLRQVEDLLSLTALEAGGVELLCAPFDVAALVDSLIEASGQQAADRGLSLFSELELPERWFLGDAQRIKQILRNLVDNALKFSERSSVCVRASERAEDGQTRIVFEVEDSGAGMDSASIESMLLPFRQGDASSSRRYGGVGLGLAIVARLVRAMQGTLSIQSELGLGTTVRVSLPLPKQRPLEEPTLPLVSKRSGTALVVDDSAPARELLCELLRLAGFQAREASSAEHAKALVARHSFDVIFLDYQMPESDGAEAALLLRRSLLAREGRQHVPIYILTANVFVHEQLRDARASVDGILGKPLSRAALAQVLRGLPSAGGGSVQAAAALLDARVVEDLRTTPSRDGRTLLASYLPRVEREMAETLVCAHEALAGEAWAALARAAHAAAGHAALLGAERSQAAARALEELLAEPNGQSGRSPAELLSACEAAFAEAVSLLQTLVRSVEEDS